MCFSFEISLLTGIFSWSVAFYLLKKPLTTVQRQKVIMLLLFSSMQFVDAILWYIKMKKNNVNYVVTSLIIPIILSLQIIYNIYVINNINNTYVTIIIFISILYLFVRFNGYSTSLCSNKLSSPIWASNEIKLWEIIIFSLLISTYPYIHYPLIPVLFIPLLFNGAYGSMWCAIANITAVYFLLTY